MNSIPRFPVECLEDIFNHLSGNDLLKCSLVCPEWNNFFGSTKSCMKKIKIRIQLECNDKSQRKLKRILSNSKRNYFKLYLNGHYFKKLMKYFSGRTLTHLESRSHLGTFEDFYEFVKPFQSSVKNLALNDEKSRNKIEPVLQQEELHFP